MEEHGYNEDRELGKSWNAAGFQNIILLTISALFLLALGAKLFLNVSRIDFVTTPRTMFPDGGSTVTVKALPYNMLGFRIPFKSIQVYYIIRMGEEKVDIISRSRSTITLRAKKEVGQVVIEAKPVGGGIPYEIIILIVPQIALNID
jgi:hypothetical protein